MDSILGEDFVLADTSMEVVLGMSFPSPMQNVIAESLLEELHHAEG